MSRLISSLAAAGCLAVAAGAALAGPERVTRPENIAETWVHYLDVDRHDRNRVRSFFVNPEAHAAATPGEPLPDGTVLVMADRDAMLDADGDPVIGGDGRLVPTGGFTNMFVMEKRAGWGEDVPPDLRNGDWDYAWYQPDGTLRPGTNYEGCFACHQNRTGRDFTFTYWKYLEDRAGED